MYPTLPAASLQASPERPASSRSGREAFDVANAARQQEIADAAAEAAGRPRVKLLTAVVNEVNRLQWNALTKSQKSRWHR